MTKAELEAEVERLTDRNTELRQERDAWRAERLTDSEAEAIAKCVKALDEFRSVRQQGNVMMYSYNGSNPMRRMLRFLADRYGVEWFDPPPQPEPSLPTSVRAAAEAVLNYERDPITEWRR